MPSVYVIQIGDDPLYKIGYSAGPAAARMEALQCGSPHPLRLVHEFEVQHPRLLERRLHSLFGDKRTLGEWFRLDAADLALLTASASGVESWEPGADQERLERLGKVIDALPIASWLSQRLGYSRTALLRRIRRGTPGIGPEEWERVVGVLRSVGLVFLPDDNRKG